MCSIYGAIGFPDKKLMKLLECRAGDRGRDGGRNKTYQLPVGHTAILGNWRATPTLEVESVPLQPYEGVVHNGTIANDDVLLLKYYNPPRPEQSQYVDSMILARAIRRSMVRDVGGLAAFLHNEVQGSYALAMVTSVGDLLLACNYKPIYYWSPDDQTFYFSSMARHFQGVVPRYQSPVMMPPYSTLNLRTGESGIIPREDNNSVVVIASAGLDSTVVATHYVRRGCKVHLLHFAYGCHASRQERERIPRIAESLGCAYSFQDLPYGSMRGGSPLLLRESDIALGIAGAEYAHEWVPARNLVMVSVATAFAEANGYHVIALGNNLEEAGAYPDNEEQMIVLMNKVLNYAVQNGYSLQLESPIGHLMKHEVVKLGLELNAPLAHTWSCYRGGSEPCGRCGPCFMRKVAFERNDARDPMIIS